MDDHGLSREDLAFLVDRMDRSVGVLREVMRGAFPSKDLREYFQGCLDREEGILSRLRALYVAELSKLEAK